MRLINIISDAIPRGRYWTYLHTFVEVLAYMIGGATVLVLMFVTTIIPLALALYNESGAHLLWYFLTIPSLVTANKFVMYHMGWD